MTLAASHLPDPALIEAETAADAEAVDALVLAAFGPGRFAKTAERLRESARRVAGFVVRRDGAMIGSVRLWAITVGGTPALFLGPIAVEADRRSEGLGAALVSACVEHAQREGAAGVLLVGDPPFFSRFGFQPAPDAVPPGPVDRDRMMWLPLGVARAAGPVLPA